MRLPLKLIVLTYNIMNYSPFEACLHSKTKPFNYYYNTCLSCGEKSCSHPFEYMSLRKPDRYTQECMRSMPWKNGLYEQKFCTLCNENLRDNICYN